MTNSTKNTIRTNTIQTSTLESWQAISQIRKNYDDKHDPIKVSVVEWLTKDRRSH